MASPRILVLGTGIVLILAGAASASIKAVAGIHPVSAIVREIGGDKVEVTTIVPAGADPHHFELTPRKARAIYGADVVFLIGDHFDQWLLPGDGKDLKNCLIVSFYEDFSESLLAVGNTFNPHFWLDPLYAKKMGEIVAETLCSVDTANCSSYRRSAEDFDTVIDSVHISISSRLEASGFNDFVAFHPAWSYFARRYGLREHGTLEISHEQEPSAKHIAEVVRHMITSGVEFIVVEEFSNADLAEGVASQTGARIIYLDPLGGADIPGRDTYTEILNHNVSVMEKSVREE